MTLVTWTGVAAFVVSLLLTGLIRRYALKRLLDLPNERSSHKTPTPRGGGVAVAIVHMLGVALLWQYGLAATPLAIALVAGGFGVFIVGFVDDHRPLPPAVRLSIHFVAVLSAVVLLAPFPPFRFGSYAFDLGIVGTAAIAVYVVWFLNLFNFMDGIDGIAGAQAVTMSVGAFALSLVGHGHPELLLPISLLGFASAGFLVWNWPPARIFMGDGGSGYVGFALGVLACWTISEQIMSPWSWLILGGVFVADATTTLLVRAVSGAPPAEAHRSHAYQRLSRLWSSHARVTLLVLAVNVFWLLPAAWMAAMHPAFGALLALGSLGPLFLAVWMLGAGRPGDIVGVSASRHERVR